MSDWPASLAKWEVWPEATEAERTLIAAARVGEPCSLGAGDRPEVFASDRHIRAPLLCLIATGATPECGLPGTGVWLEGAWITETLDLRHAAARGEIVLDFCTLVETPQLGYAQLTMLSLDDSTLPGLIAQRAVWRGDLFLRRAKVSGTIDLNGATIDGQLACEGATLDGRGEAALNAQGMTLGESFFLMRGTVNGTIDINAATISGQLAFEGATLNGNGGLALNAQRLRVEQVFIFRRVETIRGDVLLTAAHAGDLVDDLTSWTAIDGSTKLNGFTYDRIHGATDAPTRLAWLEKCASWRGEVFPQPYTQLAEVLAATGHARAARLVLHRRGQRMAEQEYRRDVERHAELRLESGRLDGEAMIEAARRGDRHWLRMTATRAWTLFLDRLIGYGHRPEFTAGWALGTFLLAALVYGVADATGGMVPNSDAVMISTSWTEAMAKAPNAPTRAWVDMSEGRHYETFAALPYALDVVLPIVDLGQQSAWAPTTQTIPGTIAWVATWVFTLFGWMLSALLVAALTGLIQKNQPGADQ